MTFRHATFAALTLVPLALLANWPQWRGPNRDGISIETGLLKAWPAAGPPLVWKTQGLGDGYSGFSVLQGRLYTQGQRGSDQFVIAIDTASGKKVWETKSGRAFDERRGPGPRGTPTTDGDRLYAQASDGTLACLKAASGEKVWEVDLLSISGGSIPTWGISGSPLVDGNRLIVAPGGRNGSILALDKMTGKVIWKSQSDDSGYSSPIVFDHNGTRQIAILTGDAALGLQASDGKLMWRYEKVANDVANIATPIYYNGHLFVSTDYGTGCALLRLGPKGAEEVYFNRDMRNHYSSSVLIDGYLYGFSSTILTAMKWDDGQVAWRDRSVGKGSVAYAEGRLYVLGENGNVALVEVSPAGYKEISRFSIPQGRYFTWTPPVIANGRLYLREQDQLYSYNVSAANR
jgi:outer membrane protein assembly factor BamB